MADRIAALEAAAAATALRLDHIPGPGVQTEAAADAEEGHWDAQWQQQRRREDEWHQR